MGTTKKTSSKRTYTRRNVSKKRTKKDVIIERDIKIVFVFCLCVFLFVCNFGVVGKFGNILSGFFFGVFGTLNYVITLFVAGLYLYFSLNGKNKTSIKKTISACILFMLIGMVIDLISGNTKSLCDAHLFSIGKFYAFSKETHKGGGIFASSVNYGLLSCIDLIGTIIFIIAILLVCVIVLTEKSLVEKISSTKDYMMEKSQEDKKYKEEIYEDRREELLRRREEKALKVKEEKRLKEEEALRKKEAEKQYKSDVKVLRKNQKAVGVTLDTTLSSESEERPVEEKRTDYGDIHEITLNGFEPATLEYQKPLSFEDETSNNDYAPIIENSFEKEDEDEMIIPPSPSLAKPVARAPKKEYTGFDEKGNVSIEADNQNYDNYKLPPLSLLTKGTKKTGDSQASIRQTALKLQETLAIFGVEATVTDISQGPTVTRFELQPKMGVKVSRIKNLSDDIKLNLAASEIRIEAPIPGKAAIGIEVPNKESMPVLLRDLLESKEYQSFDSNLSFAVGKDITGKTIVYNINNFPHLLIAGATGSGKSVCINTMIMSILYKANPDDVKIIMIDPKVVELSVYNGIPHLCLPVVTDIKKAAATLNYAVNEMHERFNKFAELGVRDIEGYTSALKQRGELEEKKMPHLVIIVDEVADLMLSERKNVEDSIQSLTQLARAAGIHLIIATQRPSVDVITGVIKANMPSRIAFAVSSNVDSRTILDMGGAEELLGKGDMLFFPKGLKKPVRLQGGFVSDKEVNDVVEFVKKQGTPSYDAMIEEKIKSFEKKSESNASSGGYEEAGDGNDSFFTDAGFYIIDNNKASIGMLQRKFKMGFNRAARIMDQLADAGVVGPDEGTKPRQILMSHEQFENYLEEYGG